MVATHKDIDDVANIDIPLIEILTQIETNQLEQSVAFERALRLAEDYVESDNEDNLAWNNFAVQDSLFKYLARQVDIDLESAEQEVEDALKRTSEPSQRIKLRGLLLSVRKLENDHNSYEKHVNGVLDLLERGDLEEAFIIATQVEQEENQFNKQVEGVLMRHEMFTESLVQLVEQEEVISMKWIVSLTLLFIILSLLAVYTFSYQIWRPLEDIRSGAEKIGGGNYQARVKLRSNSITYDIVESFNEMAEKLYETDDQIQKFIHFSFGTANDLKAPLTNQASLLEMLAKEDINASNFKTVLRNAQKLNTQMRGTVEALTEINRVREELDIEGSEIIIEEVYKEVVTAKKDLIQEANVTIKKDFSECNLIEYPKKQLKVIFDKILTNSMMYRDPEKPLIIKIKSKHTNGRVTLIINDNGLGFDGVKYREEVLKPYFRTHAHVEGAGMGLYTVKTIIDHHKGAIRIESEPKSGTTIALRLN